jgi:PadR family transcriptional regulator AphA
MVRATPAGRAALRRWLDTPTTHVRDVRTELLLKLAFLERRNVPTHDLIARQLEELAPVFDAVNKRPTGDGFDRVLELWRREQAAAVQRFLRVMADS